MQILISFFRIKLLWAAFVDGLHIKKLGQRKTWVVFAQGTVGLILLLISMTFDDLAASKNIITITIYFFILIFMVTVQDIAVDGKCRFFLFQTKLSVHSSHGPGVESARDFYTIY